MSILLERRPDVSDSPPKDRDLLDLLMASASDVILSKDSHLLDVNKQLGVPVYEPKELKRLGII